MDARPTPEQRELDDAAARLGEKLGLSTVGDLDDADRRARLGTALDQAGWRELRGGTPDEPWASGVEVALVARRLGRFAADVAYLGPVLALDALRRVGADADAPTVAVSAELDVGDPALAVDAAGAATAVAVSADGTVSTFALAGIEPVEPVDLTRTVLPVAGSGDAVGRLDEDARLAWEALAVTITAADIVGAMEGAFELANEYAKERRQFGAPIGSFQAVQHLLAEAKTLIEGATSALNYAAWAVDALAPREARMAAAVAKAYAARAGRTICETSIQVHGGIGNTWECMAHVYLRRVLLSSELFGGEGAQLALIARQRQGVHVGLS
jgi:hypothetical protein